MRRPFQASSPLLLGVLSGIIMWFPGSFPGNRFLPNLTIALFNKIPLSFFSHSLRPPIHHPDPKCSHSPSPPLSRHSQFTQRSHLFPFPRMMHAPVLVSSVLPCFSRAMDCSLVILCFLSNIKYHLWVKIYCVCFSGPGLPYSGCFDLVPSICLWVSWCHCFLPLSNAPLCKCTTFPYPFVSWKALRLLPASGYYK